jgi:hypothetical protein
MNSKILKRMVLPRANPKLVWCSPLVLVNEQSKHSKESMLQIPLPSAPTINIFYTGNKRGPQDHAFPDLSWSHKQEHHGFILVQAPLEVVIALHPAVCY